MPPLYPQDASSSSSSSSRSGCFQLHVDRGAALNQFRRQERLTDCILRVGQTDFPVHRVIVALQSPVLEVLTNPDKQQHYASNHVPDPASPETQVVLLDQFSPDHFSAVLDFLYCGSISVNAGNVFAVLEAYHFLQLDDSALLGKCVQLLQDLVPRCPLDVFVRIWDACECYDLRAVRDALLRTLDYRLTEHFLAPDTDLFGLLGFEEVHGLLSRPTLCVRSELALFDRLAGWMQLQELRCDQDGGDNSSPARQLLSLLHLHLIQASHVRLRLSLTPSQTKQLRLDRRPAASAAPRACRSCTYLFPYQRSPRDVLGLADFLSFRQDTFLCFTPSPSPESECDADQKDTLLSVSSLASKTSFINFYGPHSRTHYNIVVAHSGESLYALGGSDQKAKMQGCVRLHDIKEFSLAKGQWQGTGNMLPRQLYRFGCVEIAGEGADCELFICGGYEDYIPNSAPVIVDNQRGYVSRKAFVAGRSCDSESRLEWRQLPDMPRERRHFSVAALGRNVFVVGNGFCDVCQLDSGAWSSVANAPCFPSSSSSSSSKEETPPLAVVLGTHLYVFGDRPAEGGHNRVWALETGSGTWRPVRAEMRHDLVWAFAHNSRIYLMGSNRRDMNAVHCYDPGEDRWTMYLRGLAGVARPGALLRRQVLAESFFNDAKKMEGRELEYLPQDLMV